LKSDQVEELELVLQSWGLVEGLDQVLKKWVSVEELGLISNQVELWALEL
jgi:hypothetical protein